MTNIDTTNFFEDIENITNKNDKINKEFMNQLEVDIDSLNKKEIQLKKELKDKKRKNLIPFPNNKKKFNNKNT